MLENLARYYTDHGIAANGFRCPHETECAHGAGDFVAAKEASVGQEYERGTLPRLLFISSDPASAITGRDQSARTTLALREWEKQQSRPFDGGKAFPKNCHWYRTYDFAYKLLYPIAQNRGLNTLSFSEMHKYFAHTNSAKCKDVKLGAKEGNSRMFRNCREFLPGEVETLQPDIVVTQGAYARESIANAFRPLRRGTAPNGKYHATVIKVGPRPVLKFEMVHPNVRDNSYRNEVKDAWGWYIEVAKVFAIVGEDALSLHGFCKA